MGAADEQTHKSFTAFALFVIVASLFIIAVTFVISVGATTSSGFSRGQNVTIPLGVVSVLPILLSKSAPVSWFISRVDSITGHRTEMLAVQDVGHCAGDTLPLPNVPLSATFSVAHDGKLVFSNWKTVSSAKPPLSDRRSVAAYCVVFENNSVSNCSLKTVLGTMESAKSFFLQASSSRVVFELITVHTVLLPQASTNFSNVFSLADLQAGHVSADHHLVFLPSSFRDDTMPLLMSGFGEIGGSISWIKGCCVFSDVARGLANKLGHDFDRSRGRIDHYLRKFHLFWLGGIFGTSACFSRLAAER